MSDTGNPPSQIVSVDLLEATARTRMQFGLQHLLAAARFSRAVGEIEATHQNDEFGDWWEAMLHNSVACVLTAVSSLEAIANELYVDRQKTFPSIGIDVLDTLWERLEQRGILDKFDVALELRRKPRLDHGASPYQDVATIIALRNALVHFKPEWSDELAEHKKLSDLLRYRIKHPPRHFQGQPLFSMAWANHSCTTWVVNSMLQFSDSFCEQAGLKRKFSDKHRERLTP